MLRGGLIGADTQEFLDLCLINSALISSSSSQCVVFMCILKFLLWMKCNHTTASLPCLLSDFHKWLLVINWLSHQYHFWGACAVCGGACACVKKAPPPTGLSNWWWTTTTAKYEDIFLFTLNPPLHILFSDARPLLKWGGGRNMLMTRPKHRRRSKSQAAAALLEAWRPQEWRIGRGQKRRSQKSVEIWNYAHPML